MPLAFALWCSSGIRTRCMTRARSLRVSCTGCGYERTRRWQMAGTLSEKVVDGLYTVRRRLRWTKVLDWLSLRASPSKKACEAIDRTPMPIGSHHLRPDSPAPLEVAAHWHASGKKQDQRGGVR